MAMKILMLPLKIVSHLQDVYGNENINVFIKNCAPFKICLTHVNYEHIDTAENLDIIMPMVNLIEYSDNYSHATGSLWKFKINESHISNGTNPENIDTGNLTSFKYILSILEKQADGKVLKKVIFGDHYKCH